ncbi:MAG: hypothetical protein H0T95_09140, partial [Chthoniobacterales bacterium]|nr:hypothetical protein [Chthoniobacterales bacterium]
MFRVAAFLILTAAGATLRAETPARSSGAQATTPTSTATPAAAPSPTPSTAPTTDSLINSLGSADLQQAIQLLKSNFINPDALNETELNRALLAGVLSRLDRGAMILPERPAETAESASAFY